MRQHSISSASVAPAPGTLAILLLMMPAASVVRASHVLNCTSENRNTCEGDDDCRADLPDKTCSGDTKNECCEEQVFCDDPTGTCMLIAWNEMCTETYGSCGGYDDWCTKGPEEVKDVSEGTCTGWNNNECIYRWCAGEMTPPSPSVCLGDCMGSGDDMECTFTASVDYFASELGYFKFDECGDVTNPTLGLQKGVTYRFVQEDITNYYHPMGFSYSPNAAHGAGGHRRRWRRALEHHGGGHNGGGHDGGGHGGGGHDGGGHGGGGGHSGGGGHGGGDEVGPSTVPPGSMSSCDMDNTCPAPMYILDGMYLGTYSNNDKIAPLSQDSEDDFGLDMYEPQFFGAPEDWAAKGKFEIALKFDVDDFMDDIFYFCHIHQFMSARIKWVDEYGSPINSMDMPEIPYDYDMPGEFDKQCGTFDLDDFQLPNSQCPDRFVCTDAGDMSDSRLFSDCIEAMNCHMTVGMTTKWRTDDPIALFSHQMIPHHQNAVNMAKTMLKLGDLDCPDITVESDDCTMKKIMLEIINGQNLQIQLMRQVLESKGLPEMDDCEVQITM